jgi:protein phosphatase 2C family protein 2/3
LNSEEIVCKAITQAFMDLDIEMYSQNLPFGTTCTCLLIDYERNKIYQANLGDSRSILFCGNDIVSVTSDHDPMNELEKSRILKAGGTVLFGRVNGELMLSRAFGDFDLKSNNDNDYDPINGMISAIPDINVIPIIHNMFFLVTSDAPFESFDNDSLLILTNECLVESQGNLQDAASILAKKINSKTTDDITVIIGRI